tara:strand:- start:121 stop:294 length:174 start_codon:yes stop_codon:yes gene_type:complete
MKQAKPQNLLKSAPISFKLMLSTSYLHRPLVGQIFGLNRQGGLLLFENFGQDNTDFG